MVASCLWESGADSLSFQQAMCLAELPDSFTLGGRRLWRGETHLSAGDPAACFNARPVSGRLERIAGDGTLST
jgi:hypothetical protein